MLPVPVQVTIRDVPNSLALENHIRERAQKLSQYYDRIMSCHVVVDVPQKHKHQGKLYSVHIDLTVPGKELVVSRKKNEDIYVATRDAFRAAERQLEQYVDRKKDSVKGRTRENNISQGKVARLFMEERYGFIQDIDGSEVYFNSASVTSPPFDQLAVGDVVQFIKMSASEGLHAQRVIRDKVNSDKEHTN